MLPTRRQKAVLDAIQGHVAETGQMPTLSEIARRCGLSSVATVHRHVALLQERGLLRRRRSRRRGIELRPAARSSAARSVAIAGRFASGRPIEPLPPGGTAAVPRDMIAGQKDVFALVVGGDALRPEQILDGDVIVLDRRERAVEGETVVALSGAGDAFLMVVRRDRGQVRLLTPPAADAPAAAPQAAAAAPQADGLRVHGVVLGLLRRFE